MSNRKAYQMPQVVALGAAQQLTLGDFVGCKDDATCCHKNGTAEE